MLKAYSASFAAALLVGLAGPSLAQTSTAAPVQPQTTARPANDPNEIICEKKETTGSRIGAKKVCMTRAEWADRRLQDRQELERVQIQRGAKGD